MLYVSPGIRERLAPITRGYGSFAHPGPGVDSVPGLDSALHTDARRYDTPSLSAEALAFAEAALDTLAEVGWPAVHERGRTLAAQLATALADRGHAVAARGETTLVAFSCVDAKDERDRLAERGVIVRDLPGRGQLRASVGAWNDEHDVDRLLAGLEATGS
jgi:L-cysteine/cystine lyase